MLDLKTSSFFRVCHDRFFHRLVIACLILLPSPHLRAQSSGESISASASATSTADDIAALALAAKDPKPPAAPAPVAIDVVSLLIKGGFFMIPIGIISLIAMTFAIERTVGLRRARLLPRGLVKRFATLARESESIDPRIAFPICLDFQPSAAASVLQTVLLRAGRPLSELEATAVEASQREAENAYAGVRWLSFIASLAPLLGLLGTVWGLIQAFHDMTMLTPSQNRAEFLGRGIYIALVTTLAGLSVAIPASFMANWFEGRIQRYFGMINEFVSSIIPKLERFEGRIRFEAIGRELVAKSFEPQKKAVPGSESGKPPVQIPVQTVTFSTTPSHAPPPATQRKTIYKP